MSIRSVAALTAALLSAPVLLLTAAPAWAHIERVGSDPAAGTLLREAPESITLDFSEPVALRFTTATLRIDGADAGELDVRTPTPQQLRVAVPDTASAGGRSTRWVLSFRTTSVDGHPVSGDVAFTVAAVQAASEVTESPTAEPTEAEATQEPTERPSTESSPRSGPPTSPERDDSNPWIATGVIGLIAVVGTGGVIWMLTRRRSEDLE